MSVCGANAAWLKQANLCLPPGQWPGETGDPPGFGIEETSVLQLQFIGLETLHRFERQALIATLARQDLARLQPPGDPFMPEEDLHVGAGAGAPHPGKRCGKVAGQAKAVLTNK